MRFVNHAGDFLAASKGLATNRQDAGDFKSAMVVWTKIAKTEQERKEEFVFAVDRRDAMRICEFLPFFFLGLR